MPPTHLEFGVMFNVNNNSLKLCGHPVAATPPLISYRLSLMLGDYYSMHEYKYNTLAKCSLWLPARQGRYIC